MSSGIQHKVPRFYLRFFQSSKGKNWIFQGSIANREWNERKISEVEASYRYYGSEQDQAAQRLEDEAARVLRRIANCRLPMRLLEGDRECISRFVIHQMMRVESMRLLILDATRLAWEDFARGGHATEEQIAEPLQVIDECRAKEEAVLPMWEGPDGGRYDAMVGFDANRVALEAAQSGRFRVAVAPEGNSFITSDNPVSWHRLTHQFGEKGAISFPFGSEEKSSIFFPLSPVRAVMIGGVPWTFKRTTACSLELSEQDVAVFNRWTALMARRHLYAAAPVDDLLELGGDQVDLLCGVGSSYSAPSTPDVR